MESVGYVEMGIAGLVAVTLVLSGPAFGLLDVTARNPTTLGDGTANATVETLDTGSLVIDRGRFGTGIYYLRVPEATVAVSGIDGRPRLVYRIQVPALDVDVVSTELLRNGRTRSASLRPSDRGLDPDAVAADSYVATVSVRVQSFTSDVTVYRVNESVEVQR